MMKSVRNEKGIALVLVLVLALISLAFVSALLFMATEGTRMSGSHRLFRSAEDANYGGINMIQQYLSGNGALTVTAQSDVTHMLGFSGVNYGGCNPCSDDPDVTSDNLDLSGVYSCRCDKLCNRSSQWNIACDDDLVTGGLQVSLDPTINPDMQFTLGAAAPNMYTVFGKIVDTVKGNTADSSIVGSGTGGGSGGGSLGGFGTTETKTTYSSQSIPTLYRIEVQAQATNNPSERSRLSILYAR